MNQFLGSLALLPVEKILNAIVARDPHIAKKLVAFDSTCIEVVSLRPDFSLSIRFEDSTIKLSAIDSQTLGIQADATISGPAESLLGFEHKAITPSELSKVSAMKKRLYQHANVIIFYGGECKIKSINRY